MATETATRRRRLRAAMREGEQVTPLELFFDLVFVLALTQCTQLMSNDPTWGGLAQGLLVLGVLWWSWVGYAWLTSVVDPEEDAVRGVIFVAMAALLLVALCVPGSFDDLGLAFALTYGVVRVAHIGLFFLASRDDPDLRQSVVGLAVSTAVGVGILVAASSQDGFAQGALWGLALALDMAGPYFFGAEGWKLVPAHFAERHGLIIIIALGESIVAIGIGVGGDLTVGQGVAAVLGMGLAAAMWWQTREEHPHQSALTKQLWTGGQGFDTRPTQVESTRARQEQSVACVGGGESQVVVRHHLQVVVIATVAAPTIRSGTPRSGRGNQASRPTTNAVASGTATGNNQRPWSMSMFGSTNGRLRPASRTTWLQCPRSADGSSSGATSRHPSRLGRRAASASSRRVQSG